MSTKYIIYGLIDPRTEEIRYIGKSTSGLSRPKSHLNPSKYNKENNYKANWIKGLAALGLQPTIIIIKMVETAEELCQLEIDIIADYKSKGARLTNLTNGGEGALGRINSDETKEKMAKARADFLATLTEPLIAVNKKEHVVIAEIPHKHCFECNNLKPLFDFTKQAKTWDGLKRNCKTCNAERTRQYRIANPPKKLTPEELKQSYIDRKAAMTAGVNAAYETKPEIKQRISAQNSKAIEGTNIITGEKIYFNSALEAKAAGFQNSNLGQAIRNDVPYRGYTWKFI